ncbi:tetratricopeptide repeat protein [Bacteroides fragilis]
MKNTKSFYIIFLIMVITACTPFGLLHKEQPRVTLALPARQETGPMNVVKRDSVSLLPVSNFTFVNSKGDSIPVGMSVEWDSIHKENLTTLALDEVVVSARSTRNTAERNGMVNIEFVVTVPQALQKDNWMLNIRPVLMRGDTPDSLKELRFTGQRFREAQERDYRHYDRFVEKIIPDSVNFYRTYVNYHSFERYLERLKWYKRGLEKRWAIQDARKRRPDSLLLRFDMFNRQVGRRDSLMKSRMLDNSQRMITRQWWRYGRAWERMNDTLQFQSRHLLERFRFFNNKWADNATFQSDGLIARKNYFRDKALSTPMWQAKRALYKADPDAAIRIYASRFGYFNDKMERLDAILYRYYRTKGARAESREGVRFLRAFMVGRDTTSSYLNRNQLTEKYIRRYEKVKNFFPMFHFRRPDPDTLSPLWETRTRIDTMQTRHTLLSKFSKEDIYEYYVRQQQGVSDRGMIGPFRGLLPLYTYHRDLPDSIVSRVPGRKTRRDFELSRFDSATTVNRYIGRYEFLRSTYPQYRLIRKLYNIHPPALRHAARQASYEERLARINSLDSTSLIKMFYNTQKIARNEARKAMKDTKYRDIVRFPFNPEAQLDTVIYATDQVHFLYSQKVPADENSARMKVYVVGDVLNSNGSRFSLPYSDTLTYLVSSMTKFVDRTPRFVRKIVTRDAEANASVNFYFPKNSFRMDETIDINRQGVKQVHNLTLALMTDPVYIIDSLTLLATSSPEGNWHVNGEIARKRAESIRNILVEDFKQLYDSLAIGAAIEMDEAGNIIRQEMKDGIPNLPELIKIRTVPEGWEKLRRLIVNDKNFQGNKGAILRIIDREQEPDRREWLIKSQYKTEYAYMLDKLYPVVRRVDFLFSLSRRGMRQDTLYTNEPDTMYARAVDYLEKRKYEQALEILRPYEDVNTAIAYMSLGYDKAALRILEQSSQTAETQYMQAILNARLGNEQRAVSLLLSAAEVDDRIRFRANLDPELSLLVKKYGLFKEDDLW